MEIQRGRELTQRLLTNKEKESGSCKTSGSWITINNNRKKVFQFEMVFHFFIFFIFGGLEYKSQIETAFTPNQMTYHAFFFLFFRFKSRQSF